MNPTWVYVGVLYAIAVALARRGGVELRRRVALFFFAAVVVFLWKPMTGPYANIATDVLQLMPPWSATAPPEVNKLTVSNYESQDVVMQLVPWAHQVREAWKSGSLPLWQDLTGSGFPLIANGQGQALSPLRLLALPLPLHYAITAEGAFKILIGLTLTFLYCRRRGYGELPSIIAATIFGFGPFLIIWLHYAQASVACFLPAVMLAVDLLAERRTFARFAFAASMGPLVLFTGHPETVAHMFVFAAAYVVWVLFFPACHPERSEGPPAHERGGSFAALRMTLGGFLAVGAVSVLLSLPFLVPFFEGMRKSIRYQMVATNPHRGIPFSDFPSMVVTFQPRIYGTRPQAVAWGPAQAESLTAFAGMLAAAAWFGMAAWVVARRRWRSRECFLVLAALLVYLVLDDFEPVSAIVKRVLAIAPNARFRLILAWCGAVLTAAFVDLVRRGERMPLIAGLVGASATLAIIFTRIHFPDDAAYRAAIHALIPSAIPLVLAALYLLRLRVTLLLLVAINAEIWLVTRHWNPARPLDTFYPRTPLIEAVQRAQTRSVDRAVALGGVLFPNLNLIYGIEDVRVLDAMAPGRYFGAIRAVSDNLDPLEYYPKWNDPDTPLLDYLGARWMMTEAGRELDRARYELRYDGPDGRLYENKHALPRFFAARNVLLEPDPTRFAERFRQHTDWRTTALVRALHVHGDRVRDDLLAPRAANAPEPGVQILRAAPTDYTLAIDAPRHALIVSSVGYWEGWRVEGLKAELVNGAFLGFVVPPGKHTLRVHYVPVTFYAACGVALLTLTALALARLRERARRHAATTG